MYLAVDIGGTKTLVATLDDHGVIQQRLQFPTPKEYSLFIRKLSDTVAYLSTNKFIATGVGAPGKIEREHGFGLAMGNLPWKSVPLRKDISRISHTQTVIENDAKLAGLSEAMLLKDTYSKVLYITLGTGIGTALIIDQEITPAFADAEGGKILLEYKGKLQEWEDFASGRAIKKQFGMPASQLTNSEAWDTIAHNVAVGLIDLLAIIQPQVVVIGGGIGRYFTSFEKSLLHELKQFETPLIPIPPILQAKRPEDAVIYGCFDLAKNLYG